MEIVDRIDPTLFFLSDVEIQIGNDIEAILTVNDVLPLASDNCPLNVTIDRTLFNCTDFFGGAVTVRTDVTAGPLFSTSFESDVTVRDPLGLFQVGV